MLLQDLRYGLKLLLRAPGFTAIAVLTLALGIGANTAIFSIVNTVLLQPLPYPQPSRLISLRESNSTFNAMSVAYPNFLDWRRMSGSFQGLAAYRGDDYVLAGGGRSQEPEHLHGLNVSANLWDVLGVKLLAGPGLDPVEDRSGGAPQVVISYGLWQRRFGADPHLLGTAIPLNGKSYLVVGILPRTFWFPQAADVFTPIGQYLPVLLYDRGDHPGISALARLRDGVPLDQARAEMNGIAHRLSQLYPKDDAQAGVAAQPLRDALVGDVRSTLWLLLSAVGLVLLIACANVANLVLARATSRRRELALRIAVGASAGRILRQLLTESLLLACIGGAAGLALAAAAIRVAPALIPADLPRLHQLSLDGPVLAFTLAAALLSGALFGILPAWQSRRLDLQESLKDGGRTSSGARRRSHDALAVAEMALALMLLAGAALLLRSLLHLDAVAPGFDPHPVETMSVALSPDVLTDGGKIAAAHRDLLQRVRHLPGVLAAAETTLIPLGTNDSEIGFWQGGPAQPPADQVRSAVSSFTSPDYLRTMQIPLLRGRYLDDQDTLTSPFVVVIDDVLARQYFPGQDPIGQHLQVQVIGQATIVGVVGHVKFWGLGGDDTAKIRSQLYMCVNQIPLSYMTIAGQGLSLVVRSAGAPGDVLAEVRQAVAGPHRDQPVYSVESMDQIIGDSLATSRFLMDLLGLFALLALTLAAIGIYGVLSYLVAQRTHEIGIRMALGASGADVVRQMVGHGARLASLGALLGLAGAAATTRFLQSNLFGVTPTDPLTLAAVTVFLMLLGVAASLIPARRAARVDPVIALRAE